MDINRHHSVLFLIYVNKISIYTFNAGHNAILLSLYMSNCFHVIDTCACKKPYSRGFGLLSDFRIGNVLQQRADRCRDDDGNASAKSLVLIKNRNVVLT